MKKLIGLLLSVLFICGCARTIHPISVTEESFPLEEAIPMIEILEAPFLLLPEEGTITGEELLEYKKTSKLFDETHRASIVRSIIATDPEDHDFVLEADAAYELLTDMTYPTIYHENIAVTSAVVRRTLYKEEYSGFDKEELIITETYNGNEPMMKDFERRVIFVRGADGKWELDVCSGTIVYSFAGDFELSLKEGVK